MSSERDWSKGKDNEYREILLKVSMEAQWEEENITVEQGINGTFAKSLVNWQNKSNIKQRYAPRSPNRTHNREKSYLCHLDAVVD